MPQPKYFQRDDGAFTKSKEGVDWIRKYGEAGVYVEKADDGYWEVRENEYIPRVGEDDREIDNFENKSDAVEAARKHVMNYTPQQGELDYDGEQYVYEFYINRIDGSHNRDDLAGYVADWINRNYYIYTEYEDYESGGSEDVDASLSAVGAGEIGLTTSRERGFIKKERFDKHAFDIPMYVEEVLEERDMLRHEVHRAVQKYKVQNEPLPAEFEIEEQVLDKLVERSAEMVIDKMENPPHTRFVKKKEE